jgi:hypothetical protein
VERDLDAAAWERSRQRREREEQEAKARLERAQRSADEANAAERAAARHQSRRLALVAALVGVVAVGALVAVAYLLTGDDGSDSDEWLAQYGLDEPVEVGAAPDRLAPSSASDPGRPPPTTGRSTGVDERPALALTGSNLEAVWRNAQAFENWLLRHPDESLVAELYEPGTPTYDQVATLIGQLQRDGQRIDVVGYEIVGVTIDEQPSADVAVLRYADRWTERFLLDDGSGAVVGHETSDGKVQLWRLELHRGPDGAWRAASIEFLGAGEGA